MRLRLMGVRLSQLRQRSATHAADLRRFVCSEPVRSPGAARVGKAVTNASSTSISSPGVSITASGGCSPGLIHALDCECSESENSHVNHGAATARLSILDGDSIDEEEQMNLPYEDGLLLHGREPVAEEKMRCPICSKQLGDADLNLVNRHLDECLNECSAEVQVARAAARDRGSRGELSVVAGGGACAMYRSHSLHQNTRVLSSLGSEGVDDSNRVCWIPAYKVDEGGAVASIGAGGRRSGRVKEDTRSPLFDGHEDHAQPPSDLGKKYTGIAKGKRHGQERGRAVQGSSKRGRDDIVRDLPKYATLEHFWKKEE